MQPFCLFVEAILAICEGGPGLCMYLAVCNAKPSLGMIGCDVTVLK